MDYDKLKQLWKDRGFEIVLGLCLAFLLIFALYRKCTGQTGTWSSKYMYTKPTTPTSGTGRTPPKESSGEKECRRVLEHLFKKSFPSVRPNFLSNVVTGGNNLELDCFNSEMKLAVEYDGVQHYKYVPYFHGNKDAFTNQKYRDHLKEIMCKENGVRLIRVPYTVQVGDIQGYLIKELQKLGYKV